MPRDSPDEIHKRWIEKVGLNRRTDDPGYHDDWYWQQCGGCAHYITLDDVLGGDWGACSNPASPFDGGLRFEHDGCAAFEPDLTGRAPFA